MRKTEAVRGDRALWATIGIGILISLLSLSFPETALSTARSAGASTRHGGYTKRPSLAMDTATADMATDADVIIISSAPTLVTGARVVTMLRAITTPMASTADQDQRVTASIPDR